MRIDEKLGVPKGIDKIGEDLYNKIISQDDYIEDDIDTSYNLIVYLMDYDLTFNNVDYTLPVIIKTTRLSKENIINLNNIKFPQIVSASMKYSFIHDYKEKNKRRKIILKNLDSGFELSIEIAYLEEDEYKVISFEDIIKVLKSDLKKDTITHELKHMYDFIKRSDVGIEEVTEYESYLGTPFPKEILDLTHLIYFTSTAENLVRPSELFADIKHNKINKDNFMEFMKNHNVIKTLDEAINFNIDDFKKSLKSENISNFLDNLEKNQPEFKKIRTGDNVQDMLNIFFRTISNNLMRNTDDAIKNYLMSRVSNKLNNGFVDIISLFINDESDLKLAQETMNKVIRMIKKYDNNPESFITFLIKRLNFVGLKMKKKLYKLYDMVSDKEKNDKSILNWELHNKINSKNEKVSLVIDFDNFKNKY